MTNDELMANVDDICTSGMGGELEEWHVKELKKEFENANLTDEQKVDFFQNTFLPSVRDSCGWYFEDVILVKDLLGITTPITITI